MVEALLLAEPPTLTYDRPRAVGQIKSTNICYRERTIKDIIMREIWREIATRMRVYEDLPGLYDFPLLFPFIR